MRNDIRSDDSGLLSKLTRENRNYLYGALIIAVLSLITIFPLVTTIVISFYAEGSSLFSGFSVANWIDLIYEYPDIVLNTLIFAFGSALLTTVLSIIISWSIARTNIPFARGWYYIIFGMIFIPPIVWETVWIRLLGKNGFYTSILPFDINVFSIPGMIFVQAIFMLPLSLIVLIPVFANVDKSLEEASRISGGGLLRTARSITLPLTTPGILASFLLVLVISLGNLRVPLVIGLPANIYVLPSKIYEDTVQAPAQYGAAFVDGTLLILLAVPIFYFYRKMLGETDQYETIGGEAFSKAPIELTKRGRYLLSSAIGLFLLVVTIIPIIVMIHGSLSPYIIPFQDIFTSSHPPLTLDQYRVLITDTTAYRALRNSFIAATLATTITVGVSIFLTWVVYKSDVKFRKIIDYMSFLPIALTSVSLALGFIVIFLGIFPIGIYGTIWIIILAYITRSLATTIRVITPSVQQIQRVLLEAGVMSGASKVTRIRTIVLPLILSTVHAVGALRFAILFHELPVSILLQPANLPLVAPYLYELSVQGNFPRLAAIGVVVTMFLIITTAVIHQLGSTFEG